MSTQEEAETALLASYRADLANSYRRSMNVHSERTTRLFWAWLDTLCEREEPTTVQRASVEGEHGK